MLLASGDAWGDHLVLEDSAVVMESKMVYLGEVMVGLKVIGVHLGEIPVEKDHSELAEELVCKELCTCFVV